MYVSFLFLKKRTTIHLLFPVVLPERGEYEHRTITIGKRIKACRKEIGYSQEKLAEILYMKKSTISAYENDVHDISCLVLMEIAKALYVSPEYLLVGNCVNDSWTKNVMLLAKEITDDKMRKLLIEQMKSIISIEKTAN